MYSMIIDEIGVEPRLDSYTIHLASMETAKVETGYDSDPAIHDCYPPHYRGTKLAPYDTTTATTPSSTTFGPSALVLQTFVYRFH